MNVRVGTSGFAYKEWKGSFYPDAIAPDAMLGFYASRFSTVEINSTFYRMPQPKVVAGWAAQVSDGFSFVLKAPQRITHVLRLKEVEDPVRFFLKTAAELGQKQGPLLFQLPPNFKKDLVRLQALLALLPRSPLSPPLSPLSSSVPLPRVRVAVEFRHPSWFADDVYDALKARSVALCAVETEQGRTPLVVTAPFGYVRLRDVDYADADLARWGREIRAQPWSDAWVFFKHEDEGRGPALAARLVAELGA